MDFRLAANKLDVGLGSMMCEEDQSLTKINSLTRPCVEQLCGQKENYYFEWRHHEDFPEDKPPYWAAEHINYADIPTCFVDYAPKQQRMCQQVAGEVTTPQRSTATPSVKHIAAKQAQV
jgi:hypothetical protein